MNERIGDKSMEFKRDKPVETTTGLIVYINEMTGDIKLDYPTGAIRYGYVSPPYLDRVKRFIYLVSIKKNDLMVADRKAFGKKGLRWKSWRHKKNYLEQRMNKAQSIKEICKLSMKWWKLMVIHETN